MPRAIGIVLVFLGPLRPAVALAFPPYRNTDAGTADPWTLEARLGVLRYERDEAEDGFASLLRANFGFPAGLELVTEAELDTARGRLADAAAGGKWIPLRGEASFGIEILALLPLPDEKGAGVEASVLATGLAPHFRLHVNGAVFYDRRPWARAADAERGWKGGFVVEVPFGAFRPGLEIAQKLVAPGPLGVVGGPGLIVDLGPLDLCAGAHFGLTAVAPDFVLDLWVSVEFPFSSS